MGLSIYICPMYQALYNESMMVVNNQGDKSECYGMADWSVDPPVLKFRFPLNESSISACNNNFKVIFKYMLIHLYFHKSVAVIFFSVCYFPLLADHQ